jgi:hypothetical protein
MWDPYNQNLMYQNPPPPGISYPSPYPNPMNPGFSPQQSQPPPYYGSLYFSFDFIPFFIKKWFIDFWQRSDFCIKLFHHNL